MIRIIRTVSSLRKAKTIFKLHLLVSFEMKSNFECVFVLSRFNFSVLQKYCITTKAILLFLCIDNTIGALLLKYSKDICCI